MITAALVSFAIIQLAPGSPIDRFRTPNVRPEILENLVRLYGLDGNKAVRVTYVTGANEYWGIQQTSWTDPPILGGPTLVRTIKGREYKLYFSGAKLHMGAFEENGAVYWVVNTLLNRLSNETMIAVAKGLQPMGKR